MHGRNPYCPPDEYRPTEAEEQCWKERHGHRFVGLDITTWKCPFYEYGDQTFEELAKREAEIEKKTHCLEEFAKRLEHESDKLNRIKRGLERWRDILDHREKEVERKEKHIHYEEEVLKRLLNLDKLDMLKMLFKLDELDMLKNLEKLDKLDGLKTIDDTLKTGIEEVKRVDQDVCREIEVAKHIDDDIKKTDDDIGKGFTDVIDYMDLKSEEQKKRREFAETLSKREAEKTAKLNIDAISTGDLVKILSKTI